MSKDKPKLKVMICLEAQTVKQADARAKSAGFSRSLYIEQLIRRDAKVNR